MSTLNDNEKSREAYNRVMKKLSALIGKTRAPDFEAFDNITRLAEKVAELQQKDGYLDRETMRWIRQSKILSIALTECARVEHETLGRDPAEIVLELTHVAGQCTALLLAQVVTIEGLKSDVPKRMTRHFEAGYRAMVDSFIAGESAERQPS